MASRIRPGKKYTFAQVREFRDDPAYAGWAAKGYVWRQALDGTLELVHWRKADMDTHAQRTDADQVLHDKDGKVLTATPEKPLGVKELEPAPLIQRRTPQQRKQSLIDRWWKACKEAGTVPGLSDEQLTEFFGRPWVTGVSELSYEDVQNLATIMLNDAHNKQEAAEAKKVTRTAPSD